MQRFFDVLFSAAALLVLSPLLLPVAIILLLTGEREVFFFQDRIGRNGRVFRLFKFATMLKNSPSSGTVTIKNDPRILPVGRLLRKTKVNELPQMLNILFGDMSIVGPRPLTKQNFASYPPSTQQMIMRVRPGLSGIGSIIFRNEEELLSEAAGSVEFYKHVIAPYKGQLEEWYVEHQGLTVYSLAIVLTVWVILFPESKAPWLLFSGLPPPPAALKALLNYPDPKCA